MQSCSCPCCQHQFSSIPHPLPGFQKTFHLLENDLTHPSQICDNGRLWLYHMSHHKQHRTLPFGLFCGEYYQCCRLSGFSTDDALLELFLGDTTSTSLPSSPALKKRARFVCTSSSKKLIHCWTRVPRPVWTSCDDKCCSFLGTNSSRYWLYSSWKLVNIYQSVFHSRSLPRRPWSAKSSTCRRSYFISVQWLIL